jgi:hypothetical protein
VGRDRKRKCLTQTALTWKAMSQLAKFVLDSLNGLLYEDDQSISSLHVTKLLDNEERDCRGSTEVCLRVLQTTKFYPAQQYVPIILARRLLPKEFG